VSRPYIVGLGGTTREGSSTEKALSLALRAAASHGADTLLLCGSDINLPAYVPGAPSNTKANRITAELGKVTASFLGRPGITVACQVWSRTHSITRKT
jgi:FMN reductase